MLSNLEMVKDLWNGLADGSIEALQASKVLEIMLEKIKSPASTPKTAGETSHLPRVNTSSTELLDHTTAIMLTPLSTGMSASTAAVNHEAHTSGALHNMYFGNDLSVSNMIPNHGGAHGDTNTVGSSLPMFPNLIPHDSFAGNFDWVSFSQGGDVNLCSKSVLERFRKLHTKRELGR
jgi:hypothetical protein